MVEKIDAEAFIPVIPIQLLGALLQHDVRVILGETGDEGDTGEEREGRKGNVYVLNGKGGRGEGRA